MPRKNSNARSRHTHVDSNKQLRKTLKTPARLKKRTRKVKKLQELPAPAKDGDAPSSSPHILAVTGGRL